MEFDNLSDYHDLNHATEVEKSGAQFEGVRAIFGVNQVCLTHIRIESEGLVVLEGNVALVLIRYSSEHAACKHSHLAPMREKVEEEVELREEEHLDEVHLPNFS